MAQSPVCDMYNLLVVSMSWINNKHAFDFTYISPIAMYRASFIVLVMSTHYHTLPDALVSGRQPQGFVLLAGMLN